MKQIFKKKYQIQFERLLKFNLNINNENTLFKRTLFKHKKILFFSLFSMMGYSIDDERYKQLFKINKIQCTKQEETFLSNQNEQEILKFQPIQKQQFKSINNQKEDQQKQSNQIIKNTQVQKKQQINIQQVFQQNSKQKKSQNLKNIQQQQQQRQQISQIVKIENQKIESINILKSKLSNNSAIIFHPLNQTNNEVNLSKRLQNFLVLRGIKVQHHHIDSYIKINKNLSLYLCNKIHHCKQLDLNKSNLNKDYLHHINNFLNPVYEINTKQQAKQILTNVLSPNDFLISTYIPKSSQYQQKLPKNKFDTFSQKYKQQSLQFLQNRFHQLKYLSSNKNNLFVIIKDKQTANYMKISDKKIGYPHIIYKYDKQLNGKQSQPNCKIQNILFHSISNIIDKNQQKNTDFSQISHKINQLTVKSFQEINFIQQINNKIRQIKQLKQPFKFKSKQNSQSNSQQKHENSKDKKLFVIKINDTKSDVQQNINKILQKLTKFNKNQVSIIKTKNESILKYLKIIPENTYGSARLINLLNYQKPIILLQKTQQNQEDNKNRINFLERFIPKGPFQLQYLSRFIENSSLNLSEEYIQVDKSINNIKNAYPSDFHKKQHEKINQNYKNKLVLFYKQSCQGCHLMQDLFKHILSIKQNLSSKSISPRAKRQICLKYHITQIKQFINTQIYKYNILNDDSDIQVPQTTPTVCLINKQNNKILKLKVQHIFGLLQNIRNSNDQVVINSMIKQIIQQFQRKYQNIQSI